MLWFQRTRTYARFVDWEQFLLAICCCFVMALVGEAFISNVTKWIEFLKTLGFVERLTAGKMVTSLGIMDPGSFARAIDGLVSIRSP
jgi:hypothetical protein